LVLWFNFTGKETDHEEFEGPHDGSCKVWAWPSDSLSSVWCCGWHCSPEKGRLDVQKVPTLSYIL